MRKIVVAALTAAFTLVGATGFGQRVPQLKGVWRVAQMAMTGPNARTLTMAPGFWIFADKHFSRVEVRSDTPRPKVSTGPEATTDQLHAVYDPLIVNVGTYEVSGDTLKILPELTSRPVSAGIGAEYAMKLDGHTLTL